MAQQPLPNPDTLNLNNIQGDILSGLPKKTQTYLFFQITDPVLFRSQLPRLIPLIKTVAGVLQDRKTIGDHKRRNGHGWIQLVGVNIAFSHLGFSELGVDDSNLTASSPDFGLGQKKDAEQLNDKGTGTGDDFVPDWDAPFLQDIHGVILVSGDSHRSVKNTLEKVERIFGIGSAKSSIKEVTSLIGDVRPDKESGHEHFGFLDGISNPAIIGFDADKAEPGPHPVPPGTILTGRTGDAALNTRPEWAVEGSFLAIRYLVQKVPEFNEFLKAHPVKVPGLSDAEGSELLGARMVGRWKSGAPIDLAPFKDDPSLIKDPESRNNFRFQSEGSFQKLCPFASHIRKTNPRADLEDLGPRGPQVNPNALNNRRIVRRGIQFGPEVTPHERRTGKSEHDRGLIFACYQSRIDDGFSFIQKSWANSPDFPPFEKAAEEPGLDPLIGQTGPGNQNAPRKMSGLDPNNPADELPFPDFIISRGGEYFFTPSIKGLKEELSTASD